MYTTKFHNLMNTFVAGLILLSACSSPRPMLVILPTTSSASAGGMTVAVTDPLSNAVLIAGTPYSLHSVADNSLEGGGVVSIQLYDNGRAINTVRPGRAQTHFASEISWTPRTPGNHVLQAVASNNLGITVISAPQTVCVVRMSMPAGTRFLTARFGERVTLCDEQPSISDGTGSIDVTLIPIPSDVMPDCYYGAMYVARTVHDPGGMAAWGLFTYTFPDASGREVTRTVLTSADSIDSSYNKTFWVYLEPLPVFESGGATYTFEGSYTFQAMSSVGRVLAEDGPHPYPSIECSAFTRWGIGGGGGYITPAPTRTLTPTVTDSPTATFTPSNTPFVPTFTNTAVILSPTDTPKPPPPPPADKDGDGYDETKDCNDGDSKINPGASETPKDGIDSNCNGDDDT